MSIDDSFFVYENDTWHFGFEVERHMKFSQTYTLQPVTRCDL